MPDFFATAPQGTEDLLAGELNDLAAQAVQPTRYGVHFSGELEIAYRACLWSRISNRVLLILATIDCHDAATLYAGIQQTDWTDHIATGATLAVDFSGSNAAINNTQFGVQKVKDAIVDQLRDATGQRPQIAPQQPDVRVNVHLYREQATVSLDLAGDSLHRRGYRGGQGEAPLKENLAAAILLRAGWPELASQGCPLMDPMCGSATLPIEAALMAADIAPGLLRDYFGLVGWAGHDVALWQQIRTEARQRRAAGLQGLPPIHGSDQDRNLLHSAQDNVQRAGLEGHIELQQIDLSDCQKMDNDQTGLVVCNPPYGERLGEAAQLPVLYRNLGLSLKRCWPGWRAAVFIADQELGRYIGLRAHKKHTLYNGALRCTLLHYEIGTATATTSDDKKKLAGQDFANRLHKNLKHLRKWIEREQIACYRVYDADLPEYNLAIDLYQNDQRWVHVQEYEAPANVDTYKAQQRLNAALACLPDMLDVAPEQLSLKQRKRQRGGEQYEKLADTRRFHVVREGPARFQVNFNDYLDTGLFLDHRPIRALILQLAAKRRFLNLFGYTGSATVFAALGGATSTTTVDMSRTYLDWARRNLELNQLDMKQHELIAADVMQWLRDNAQRRFDLVFLDPPSFSRSKRMQDTLDIQRDHAGLIDAAMRLLHADGILLFSCNLRRFRLDPVISDRYAVEDITRQTIPPDFARNPRIHHCFRIRHSG